jgi:Flp pilus assembly pilin Flp
MQTQNRSRRSLRQLGQGMTEYIIIVALIAVAAIGVYTLFGKTIRAQVAGLANEVSGKGGSADVTNAQAASGTATAEGTKDKKMGSYTN